MSLTRSTRRYEEDHTTHWSRLTSSSYHISPIIVYCDSCKYFICTDLITKRLPEDGCYNCIRKFANKPLFYHFTSPTMMSNKFNISSWNQPMFQTHIILQLLGAGTNHTTIKKCCCCYIFSFTCYRSDCRQRCRPQEVQDVMKKIVQLTSSIQIDVIIVSYITDYCILRQL